MNSFKVWVKKLPVVGNFARAIFRLFKPVDKFTIYYCLKRYLPNRPLTIVQIGSNDGVSGDQLFPLVQENDRWEILFVEPVPSLFGKLKQNYGDESRFKYENSAINEDGENQFFYGVDERAFKELPEITADYRQIGSFDKAHVLSLSQGKVDQYITSSEVNCITLEELFKRHQIESLDALLMDVEGYDWKVLSQLDLNRHNPTIILFESTNLSADEKKESVSFLSEKILPDSI